MTEFDFDSGITGPSEEMLRSIAWNDIMRDMNAALYEQQIAQSHTMSKKRKCGAIDDDEEEERAVLRACTRTEAIDHTSHMTPAELAEYMAYINKK